MEELPPPPPPPLLIEGTSSWDKKKKEKRPYNKRTTVSNGNHISLAAVAVNQQEEATIEGGVGGDRKRKPIKLMYQLEQQGEMITTNVSDFTTVSTIVTTVIENNNNRLSSSSSPPPPALEGESGAANYMYSASTTPKPESANDVLRHGTIRRLMKIDPNTKIASSDAVFAMSKCAELFCVSLLEEANKSCVEGGNYSISYADVARAVEKVPNFDFLKDLLPVFPATVSPPTGSSSIIISIEDAVTIAEKGN